MRRKEKERRRVIWRNLIVAGLTLAFLLIFPLLLLLFCPIYVFRFCVGKLNVILFPDGGKILSTKSAIFAADDIYGKPRCPLLVLLLFQGKLSLERLLEKVSRDTLNKKKENSETELVYPELQQTIKKWLGFYVWRWDPNFNLTNHVGMYKGDYSGKTCTEEILPRIVNELTIRPFQRGQSPWEGYILHDVNVRSSTQFVNVNGIYVQKDVEMSSNPDEQSVLIFRLHHALADGISIRKLMLDVAEVSEEEMGIPQRKKIPDEISKSRKKSLLKLGLRLYRLATFPIRAPYETIGALWDCKDRNAWHVSEKELSGELRSSASVPVSVDFIKGIKSSYQGVTFAGVVLAALSGGIRNFMIQRGEDVPEAMHCLTPLPMPGHSEKLRNHLTAAAIRLPIGAPSPEARLVKVSKNIKALKKSLVPQTNYLFYPVIGGLFPFMGRRLFRHTFTTALLSSFQATNAKIKFLGHEVEDIIFAGGLLMGNIGVGMTLLSYNGAFRVVVGVDSAIVSSYDNVQQLVELIYDEFHVLHRLNAV